MKVFFISAILLFSYIKGSHAQSVQAVPKKMMFNVTYFHEKTIIDSLIEIEAGKGRSQSVYFMISFIKVNDTSYRYRVFPIEKDSSGLILYPITDRLNLKVWGYCKFSKYTIFLANESDDFHDFFSRTKSTSSFEFIWKDAPFPPKKISTSYYYAKGKFHETPIGYIK